MSRRAAQPRSWGFRLETFVLVLILLTVGHAAGGASFTRVHDWTMDNSPVDTPGWFGWANAVISELVPIAAMIVMRRRRAVGASLIYPAVLLIGALTFSVTAQLAVAKPGLSGTLVAVFPAIAFAGLAKLILGQNTTTAAPAPVPAVPPVPIPVPVPVAPVLTRPAVPAESIPVPPVPVGPATVPAVEVPAEPVPAVHVPAPAPVITNVPALEQRTAPGWPSPALPGQLLDRARTAAADHLAEHGRPITRDELRAVLRVSNDTASQIMRVLGLSSSRTVSSSPVPVLNGTER